MNNVDFDFNDVIIVDDDHSNRCLFFFSFFIKNYIFIIIIIITIMLLWFVVEFSPSQLLNAWMLAATTIGAVQSCHGILKQGYKTSAISESLRQTDTSTVNLTDPLVSGGKGAGHFYTDVDSFFQGLYFAASVIKQVQCGLLLLIFMLNIPLDCSRSLDMHFRTAIQRCSWDKPRAKYRGWHWGVVAWHKFENFWN